LGTVTKGGRPHATGVTYGLSPVGRLLQLYVTKRTRNKKVHNIAFNPSVSFVVPLFWRVLTFVPPACIQFQGTAEIVGADDATAIEAFQTTYVLRRILRMEFELADRTGERGLFRADSPRPRHPYV
jgi:hypothetical protein